MRAFLDTSTSDSKLGRRRILSRVGMSSVLKTSFSTRMWRSFCSSGDGMPRGLPPYQIEEFALLIDRHAFAEVLRLQHIDLEQAVEDQMVDLRHAALVFRARRSWMTMRFLLAPL